MLTAARTHHEPRIMPVVCGPSNVGNLFATHHINATCGFGVTYENLHAPNERIKLDTLQMTSDVYSTAIHSLLADARSVLVLLMTLTVRTYRAINAGTAASSRLAAVNPAF